jgi:hypothetical protein
LNNLLNIIGRCQGALGHLDRMSMKTPPTRSRCVDRAAAAAGLRAAGEPASAPRATVRPEVRHAGDAGFVNADIEP